MDEPVGTGVFHPSIRPYLHSVLNGYRMRIYHVDPEEPSPEAIVAAVEALRAGDLVILPTETVYGLACDAQNQLGVERIYSAKGRSERSPLPVQVAHAWQLRTVAEDIPEVALRAAARFWPGPLTMVLRRRAGQFDALASGGDTIAVRVPRYAVPLAVLTEFDGPLAVTSANVSGGPDAVTAEEAIAALGQAVAVILEAGPSPIGHASTVLDVTGDKPRVLRQGSIAVQDLERALEVEVES